MRRQKRRVKKVVAGLEEGKKFIDRPSSSPELENPSILGRTGGVTIRLDLFRGRGQVLESTLGLGAYLTRPVTELVDGLCFWLRSSDWLSDGGSDGFGGALGLGADLARHVAELVDGLCETC